MGRRECNASGQVRKSTFRKTWLYLEYIVMMYGDIFRVIVAFSWRWTFSCRLMGGIYDTCDDPNDIVGPGLTQCSCAIRDGLAGRKYVVDEKDCRTVFSIGHKAAVCDESLLPGTF